jgi:AcrR family transcriptional regulator
LRQIAARLEYSPTAFYTYFRSKNDIFAALVDEDMAILKRRVSEATRDVIDPLGRVRRALWTLYEFPKVNPLFLELMFVDSSAARKTAERQRFECLDGIAAGVEADLSQCIEPVSGVLTATRTATPSPATCSRPYSRACRGPVTGARGRSPRRVTAISACSTAAVPAPDPPLAR